MYLSSFLLLIAVLILLVAVLLFLYPIKVAASFNSEQQPDIHLMMSWLNPFLKGYVTRHNGKSTLKINLFNKKVLVKNLAAKNNNDLKSKSKNYMDYIKMLRVLKINRAKVFASYGFEDPSITGMIYGAIDFVSHYVNLDELYNNADFFTYTSYFNISASAEINAGVSLIRILRSKIPHTNTHALGQHR